MPFLCVIWLLSLFCWEPAAQSAEDRQLVVGIYENEPKVFTNDSGKPAGIFIDILEHIAALEGWSLKYTPGTWADGLKRLERGEIDLMPDVALNAEREKLFSFHGVPVLSSWSQIFARKGSGIHSILDLNGKRVLVLKGSVQQERFSRFAFGFDLNIVLVDVPDYRTMFAEVAAGRADAAISNRFYGMVHARKAGLEDTAVVFDPSDLFFAAPRDKEAGILKAIDRHLTKMKQDHQSVYYTSLKRWTSEEVALKLPLWLKIAATAGIGLLVVSLLGGLLLKHQVNLRTRELQLVNREMEQRIRDRTAELESVNREQHSIFETASTGIVLMRERVIVRCNRKLEEIFGYDHGELEGRPTRVWYPDDEAWFIGGPPVYEQLSRGETHSRTQQLIRKDGSLFWARISCRAFDSASPMQGAVAIIEDITEEREAGERLRQVLEKAQEADRIKSAFLATMSHELRTPLNSIIGFTGIMLQGLTGPLNEEQHRQMSMVQASSRHMLALINDVLDISKIEAGQLQLACQPFDLRESLEKVIRTVMPLAEQKQIGLVKEIGEDVSTLAGDQRRLEQVVLNLLSNAVKFTDRGQVTIGCRSDNDGYLLSVADSGIGMRAEELSDIFQPFHQVDTGLARKREGTGLGLSITKKIVDMMGGTITVESRIGEGSTFTVIIPRQTGELS
jgi:PAS domain S-box-containing protein